MKSLLDLLDRGFLNFSILVTMVSLLGLTFPYRGGTRPVHQLARWLLLTGASLLLLFHSLELSPGLRTDLRFVPVALATILGGPIYGLSVALPMTIYRVLLGGVGVMPSLISLAVTVIASALLSRRRNQFQLSPTELLKSGTLIMLLGNLSYFLLPGTFWIFVATVPIKALSMLIVMLLLQTRFRLVGSYHDFRQMAYTDKLTSLSNRRQFDEDLRPGQAEPPMFLLLLDIDHFKSVNDRFGHAFGDQVLVMTAQLLRENLRQWDGAYRYGGEEFAVLLRHCTPEQARMVAERVRSSVEQQIATRLNCPVTISIGAVQLPTRQQATASLHHADQALYSAKSAGRNRVIWSEGRLSEA